MQNYQSIVSEDTNRAQQQVMKIKEIQQNVHIPASPSKGFHKHYLDSNLSNSNVLMRE